MRQRKFHTGLSIMAFVLSLHALMTPHYNGQAGIEGYSIVSNTLAWGGVSYFIAFVAYRPLMVLRRKMCRCREGIRGMVAGNASDD